MRRGALWLAMAALALSACASGPRAAGADRDTDRRLVELERQAMRQRLELERLERRLAELEAVPTNAPRRAASAMPPDAALATPQEELARPAATQTIEAADLAEPMTAAGAAAAGARSPLERYEAALELFRAGRASESEAAFRTLLDDDAPPDLADNAWFWIGEARLGRGDAAAAAQAYRTAIERYPDGNKIPDSLLKLGDALVELGDADAAQEVWTELVERFPSTASAEIARPRLEPR